MTVEGEEHEKQKSKKNKHSSSISPQTTEDLTFMIPIIDVLLMLPVEMLLRYRHLLFDPRSYLPIRNNSNIGDTNYMFSSHNESSTLTSVEDSVSVKMTDIGETQDGNLDVNMQESIPIPNSNDEEQDEDDDLFQKPKRKKTSAVWEDFEDALDPTDNLMKSKCCHCGKFFKKTKGGPTTQLKRHLQGCAGVLRAKAIKEKDGLCQQHLAYLPVEMDTGTLQFPVLKDGKIDVEKVQEYIANWVLMHEKPFVVVEEVGLNIIWRYTTPNWKGMSRETVKRMCMKIYENERKKLKNTLKNVHKISLTTDCWKSDAQRIEYMVITGHWIDQNWELQKCVLSFIDVPPPRSGVHLANYIWQCVKEWEIERKVYSISVDNASANDVAIRNLKIFANSLKKLPCDGLLFHMRCCAHILNLIAQDGIEQIKDIIYSIRESVDFIRKSESRMKTFAEIVKQLNLPGRKLIFDCKTRWNSTYEMLAAALKFRLVFPRFKEMDTQYEDCPSEEDWEKVEKVCSVLGVFWEATHIISGSHYPTSNLFFKEVYKVKKVLDTTSRSSDDFLCDMAEKMKLKFDKYWGECHLLMSVAAVLDPRCKMRFIDFCFPKIYPQAVSTENRSKVLDALRDLFNDYSAEIGAQCESSGSASNQSNLRSSNEGLSEDWNDFHDYLREVETVAPERSELETYLEENVYKEKDTGKGARFDILQWWKSNTLKYRVLSVMARDILAIPITTVASEACFSAGSRVINKYRSSLSTETVQALMCGGDWLRKRYGAMKNPQKKLKKIEVILPVGDSQSVG